MENLLSATRCLLLGSSVDAREIRNIAALDLPEHQLASLAFLLLRKRGASCWSEELVAPIRVRLQKSIPYLVALFPGDLAEDVREQPLSVALEVIRGSHRDSELGRDVLQRWIEAVVTGEAPTEAVAIWLAKVCV